MPGAQNLTPGKSNKVVIILNAVIAAIILNSGVGVDEIL